jgi:hypothetical protein
MNLAAHLKDAAPGLLPSQTSELANQKEKLQKLQSEIVAGEQACAREVQVWEGLVQQRVLQRKCLEEKREIFRLLIESVIELEGEVTESHGILKQDSAKLQETEKLIADFAKTNGSRLS